MRNRESLRKRRKTERLHASLTGVQILARQAVPRITPLKRDLRTGPAQQVREGLGLGGLNNRIVLAGRDEDAYPLQRGQGVRHQGNHGAEQQRRTQTARIQQQQGGSDVGPVGEPQRDRRTLTQIIPLSRRPPPRGRSSAAPGASAPPNESRSSSFPPVP